MTDWYKLYKTWIKTSPAPDRTSQPRCGPDCFKLSMQAAPPGKHDVPSLLNCKQTDSKLYLVAYYACWPVNRTVPNWNSISVSFSVT